MRWENKGGRNFCFRKLPPPLFFLVAWSAAAGELSVKLTPEVIRMGAFYSGAPTRIEGTVPADTKVIVAIRGADTEEVFNKKGKVGPIWINAGKVKVSGVPSLFLRFTPEPVDQLLRAEVIDEHQLSRRGMKRQMTIEPPEADQEIIRDHYLTLKAEQGAYQVFNNAVRTMPAGLSREAFRVEFQWPAKAPPGAYEVRVHACRGGNVVETITLPLRVMKVGFPAVVARLATEYPWLYGLMAVIMAVLAGFGIDLIAARIKKHAAAAPALKEVAEAVGKEAKPARFGH